MKIDIENIVSITEANQNFSRVARMADERGSILIMKNNVPRYLLVEFARVDELRNASDEKMLEIGHEFVKKNDAVFSELGKK